MTDNFLLLIFLSKNLSITRSPDRTKKKITSTVIPKLSLEWNVNN
ncbi:hypothetical protein [Chryseobacterium sediminis]|nr:hypothetical protein [Chryseobacterium sediminis]